jgi:hypothetical protein
MQPMQYPGGQYQMYRMQARSLKRSEEAYNSFSPFLFFSAVQRERERVPHSRCPSMRRQTRRTRYLQHALRDKLRDEVQDVRDRAG